MYAITDKETGNYLCSRAFTKDTDETWYFISHTGKLGTEFNSTREQAKKSLEFLNKYNKLSGFNRKLHIMEVDEDNLPLGKTVIKNSKDKCYKCQKQLDENDFIWFINQQAGYGSSIDGDKVNIKVCDDCMIKFLGK